MSARKVSSAVIAAFNHSRHDNASFLIEHFLNQPQKSPAVLDELLKKALEMDSAPLANLIMGYFTAHALQNMEYGHQWPLPSLDPPTG